MKVVPSAGNGYKKIVHLPLVDDEPEEMTKSNSISYELRTNPADATSAKYKVNLRIIDGTESVRVLITWYEIVPKVLAGMDISTYTPSKSLIERNLKGVALSNFRSSLTACSTFARKEAAEAAYANEADPTKKQAAYDAEMAKPVTDFDDFTHITAGLKLMMKHIMPTKILARCKRHLRRECRKPNDMRVRVYWQKLNYINQEELTRLPPHKPDQQLSEDEMLDILLYGTPKSWQREMDRQRFDPLEHTADETVAFMEGIEEAEGFQPDTSNNNKKKEAPAKTSKKRIQKGDSETTKGAKWCMIHGQCGHTSEECKKLQAEAKRIKSSHHSNSNGGSSNGSSNSNNKSWSKKSDENRLAIKSELHAIVEKAIEEKLSNKGKSSSKGKKRKSEDGEVCALEAILDADLKGFNYDDMDNMKIDTDTEVEV